MRSDLCFLPAPPKLSSPPGPCLSNRVPSSKTIPTAAQERSRPCISDARRTRPRRGMGICLRSHSQLRLNPGLSTFVSFLNAVSSAWLFCVQSGLAEHCGPLPASAGALPPSPAGRSSLSPAGGFATSRMPTPRMPPTCMPTPFVCRPPHFICENRRGLAGREYFLCNSCY